ncbi:MAG TPA: 5-formyltetrahydrofolate cyclo-ligase [Firmicutes bacterium]|nr:5-formyltetrahydrofolate cyclo-ligase [Bacillota bacterium]
MRPIDIRQYKNELRLKYKAGRRAMPPEEKARLDGLITEKVGRLYQYKNCRTLFIYVSTDIEVDTRAIIRRALAEGKRVAVPRCIPGTRRMEFHYIDSLEQLQPGAFSVLEPDESRPVARDFSSSLMIVPALSLDNRGYRLGYGKGYYDRYIAEFTGPTAGICYAADCRRHMYHGRFDRPVDVIVTDRGIRRAVK